MTETLTIFNDTSRFHHPSKDKLNIWTYWENPPGKSIPGYLELCLEHIVKTCKNSNVHLVTPENISRYIPELQVDLDSIVLKDCSSAIALKADFIRVSLLHEYGGLWLDIDCIPLIDLSAPVGHALSRAPLACMKKTSKSPAYFTNNFLASTAKGTLIGKYLAQITEVINKKNRLGETYEWTELGSKLLTSIIEKNPTESIYIFDEDQIHPFDFTQSKTLETAFASDKNKSPPPCETLCVMLYNQKISNNFKTLSKQKVMQSNTPISFFLNRDEYTKNIKNDFIDWSLSQMKSKTNSPELIGNELLVCEKYKLLYASCSKNACSTVKAFLASLTKDADFSNASPHHKHLTSLRGITDFKKERAYDMLFGDSAFRFTISRNPYDRAISCFLNRVDNLGLETYDNAEFAAETFKKNRVQILRWKISKNKEAVQDNRKIDFSDFIEFICQQDFRDMDRHWASQADSLHPELINYDYIGKVETLEHDLRMIMDINHIKAPESWYKKRLNTSFKKAQRDKFFNDELQLIFLQKFKKDFDTFGYSYLLAEH